MWSTLEKTEESRYPLTAVQREDIVHELTDAAERMERILKLMCAVYGDASQETSRAEQIVNAIARLKRELARNRHEE